MPAVGSSSFRGSLQLDSLVRRKVDHPLELLTVDDHGDRVHARLRRDEHARPLTDHRVVEEHYFKMK